MKKIVLVVALLAVSMALRAQEDVTRFLSIPVDGSKTEMIRKLEAKGFRYDKTSDMSKGEFNGTEVYLIVQTNRDKVWRIIVFDTQTSDETQIKIRFNNLCRQFEKNEKYVSAFPSSEQTLSEDEDISYGISVRNKQYEAVYYQLSSAESSKMKQLDWLSKESKSSLVDPSKRVVWFKIGESYGRYQIVIYYENRYNEAKGEDL